MFKLMKAECKLLSVNPRAELHGEETRMACDLKIQMTANNDLLNELAPQLKEVFYSGVDEHSDLADLGMDDDYLPTLRFPELKSINWDYKGAGYRVVINDQLGTGEDIYLIDTTLDRFKFTPQAGGIIQLIFRIVAHPNEKDMGSLCAHIQRDIELTLEPPKADKQADMKLQSLKKAS